jgi:hypothetical protein
LAAARRWARWDDSTLANTASVIPVTGTPSSNADWTAQRPVPFCSAWSKITSTSGRPLAWSTWRKTLAVISIRNDSSSPSFQPWNTSAKVPAPIPRPWPSRS